MQKIIYFNCDMGAAGDMVTAALMDLIDDKQGLLDELNHMGIPGVCFDLQPGEVFGQQMHVKIDGREETAGDYHGHVHAHEHEHEHEHEHGHHHGHEHEHEHGHHHEHEHHHGHEHEHEHGHHHEHVHHSLADVEEIIASLKVPDPVKKDARQIFSLIAEAEGAVHHKTPDQIHFHEVGTMDAVADVTAVSYLIHRLHPDKILASPVHVGSGRVRCAHGILPVPAPATAYLLRGIPVYGGNVEGELCTPTGAAILKYYVQEFTQMPPMIIQRSGYGLGKKKFETENCITAYYGSLGGSEPEEILEIKVNLDDMTAEDMAYAAEYLLKEGALDVYTCPIGMKKGRPGTLLTCLCRPEQESKMSELLLRHTSSLGVRVIRGKRHVMEREETVRETAWGAVRVKRAVYHDIKKEKPEYEDLRRIADTCNLSLAEVKRSIIPRD